jgi:hypothetical protein
MKDEKKLCVLRVLCVYSLEEVNYEITYFMAKRFH